MEGTRRAEAPRQEELGDAQETTMLKVTEEQRGVKRFGVVGTSPATKEAYFKGNGSHWGFKQATDRIQ